MAATAPDLRPGRRSAAGDAARRRDRPRRLTLVIPSLRAGGAERIMSVLANAWAAAGDDVTLLTWVPVDEAPHFGLDERVVERRLDLIRESRGPIEVARNTLHRLQTLRRAILASRPDVVVTFMDRTNVVVLAALLGTGTRTVVAEHNDPHEEIATGPIRAARRLLYPLAARVVVLTRRAGDYFPRSLQSRVRVVPNPIVLPLGTGGTEARGRDRDPGPDGVETVVAMGRLVRQKGFDRLLPAFAAAAQDRPGWRLTIWGEGGDRAALERQRAELRLVDRVSLPGVTDDPARALGAASLFVLSSRWEGFPTVLGEAMALGVPVVSVDCPSGPAEIVRDGIDGVLVPPDDPSALAAAIRRLMDDRDARVSLASRAPEVLDRFGLGRILELWDDLFSELGLPRVPAPPSGPASPRGRR